MIFTVLDYKGDRKMLEVQYLEDGKIKYAYTAYPKGCYEATKKELTEFIKKRNNDSLSLTK